MLKNLSRAAALATVLGCLAMASPSFAAPFNDGDQSGAPNSSINVSPNGSVVGRTSDTSEVGSDEAQAPASGHHHMAMKGKSPENMRARVEERISELHTRLAITKDQESQWNDVAQSMRDSEANISSLIQERHEGRQNRTAVDDMDSYQKIAQAHADGLKGVEAPFATLYASMSDAQKAKADKLFGEFEGHMASAHNHKTPTSGKPMSSAVKKQQ